MKGVKYISLLEPSGYGIVGLRYLRGLVAAGVPVTWTPMVTGPGWGLGYEPLTASGAGVPDLDETCNRAIPYDTVIVHTVPEYFERWARVEAGSGKTVVGYTVWETDKPPGHWPEMLNAMDGLLVPCHWNKEVFQRHGVTVPIEVVPHILEHNDPVTPWDVWGIRPEQFVFYTINTWTNRKAPWDTIRAYLGAFTGDDPVMLVIKTSAEDFSRPARRRLRTWGRKVNDTSAQAIEKIMGEYANPAAIHVVTDFLDDEALADLHARADCYVSLCRSEGWGLGAFDAAGAAKPIIMTGYGGQLDFLDADSSYLVGYELVPVRDPSGLPSYTPDQSWAQADVAEASQLMRHVFEERSEAVARGRIACERVREQFGSPRVTQELLAALETIRR